MSIRSESNGPAGEIDELTDVAVDRYSTVVEGEGVAE